MQELKKLKLTLLVLGLLVGSLVLAACGDTDANSTRVSGEARPATAIQGAQQNNSPVAGGGGGIPVDPTRSLTQAAGATSTPLPPTPTPQPGQPTTAPAAGGGNTPAAPGGGTGGGGNAQAGATVFQSAGCTACHANGGRAAGVGPALVRSQRDDAYIRNIIRNGRGAMPAYSPAQVNDQQLNDLLAYIRSLT